MCDCLKRCAGLLLVLAALFFSASQGYGQKVDFNGNGISDVWELIHDFGGADPNADSDGDGVINRLEALAGTNPFDATSLPSIPMCFRSSTNFSVSLFNALGKRYELQSVTNLLNTNWVTEAATISRAGSVVTLSAMVDPATKFFRVLISDVDSDGDGINDWEEYKLGLDPQNAQSNATLDQNGQPMNDLAYVVNKFAAENLISISAPDPTAVQPDFGQTATSLGTITVSRGGFPLNSVTVNLALGGPGLGFAIEGVDHDFLTRPVTIPPGASSETVIVTPLANTNLLTPVVAMMKVLPGPGYNVSSSSNASVVIYPSQTPTGTGLTGQYWDNANSTYANAANFSGISVTRVEPTIDFIWGAGTPYPQVNRDNFSASWSGTLVTPTSGNYQFTLQADDGARLYVSNQLVLDGWIAGSSTPALQTTNIALLAGTNCPIRVEYYELSNSASIHLKWKTPTASSFAAIPTANVQRPGSNTVNWLALYYNNTNLSGTAVSTNFETAVDYDWYTGAPDPILSNTLYSARWTGQIEPQYSEPYTFVVRSDDGAKLWVNGQLILDDWRNKSPSDTNSATLNLQAGVRYDLKMEYYQSTSGAEAHLSWFSPSQAKQIIPSNRLYPTSVTSAPSAVVSSLYAVGFVGQPFSNNVVGANSPLSYTANGLPPGLGFNSTNGLISGVPTLAGDFQIMISSSNSLGSGASVLNLQIFDTGSAVSREVWTNVAGVNVADIPVNSPAATFTALGALEGITDFGDNYGERIRGYFTAPATGNYYFWIAGSDSAELWISNDQEPANKVRRAWVSPAANPAPPPVNGTASRQWSLQPNQKSPWLTLVAGQKYYLEVLHKAGVGIGDNWAVGWCPDSTGTNNTPLGIVPSYLLSRYFQPPTAFIPGTLYSANLLAQGTANSTAVGSATLRVSADGTQAILKTSYSGLTGPRTAWHIHADTYQNKNAQGQIIFDIDTAEVKSDGSFVWNLGPSGTLSAADILELIQEGKAYINIHTAMYPNGEINGHFTLAEGSQTFTPPPPPLDLANEPVTSNSIARFLVQATFGPSLSEIAAVQTLGYAGWLSNQFTLPISRHLTNVLANLSADPTSTYQDNQTFNAWWQQSITAPDQLRQRVAFALSEIMVVSDNGILQDNSRALSSYYDTLLENAFGNFRQLLEAVTLTPAMGLYLDMRRNDKGDYALGTHPNENYAREILQLFSIGLNRMWPDGTLVLNSQGDLVPTYNQDVILGFARVFTGWNYYQPNQGNGRLPSNWSPGADYINPMVLVPTHHELGTKLLLDNVMLPPAWDNQANSSTTNFDSYCQNDLELALDSIFNNQNVGPFICRQLIQRLVTSHPSRDYLYRVVQKFNDNGSGVRGDMPAVISAILLDYEARSTNTVTRPTFGKQREPLLRITAAARAFPSPPNQSGTYSQNGDQNLTITTATAHRLNNSDDVFCGFMDTSGKPVPPTQSYNNVTVTSSNAFVVTAPGIATATYRQTGTTIMVTNNNHGLSTNQMLLLTFTTGGASNGVYQIATVPNANYFTVPASDSVTRTGSCYYPRLSGGGYVVQNTTNVTVVTALEHNLQLNDSVYLNFTQAGSPPDGLYTITAVPDATHFKVVVPASGNTTQNNLITLPLVPPPLVRSGNVAVQFSTWQMNNTDGGTTTSLLQTPLNSPTVFNFFFPDYKFPGLLSSAGLTTPEFQLTSDTAVVLQMNFLQAGTTGGTSANTNGLLSFNGGNGALMLDIGPWMTPAFTADAGVPALVDSLNTLMCAGQLSAAARSNIVNFVASTNLSYSTPPTGAQMRDRVRAAVHLIVTSPDFTIQK